MKREEEIEQQALLDEKAYVEHNYYAFKRGVEWADANPKISKEEFIEKVRNWLENHAYDDKYWTHDGDDLFLGNLIGDICKYLEE